MGDIGEIAKTVKPLIDNLAKLTGPMCEELGQHFGDKARAFRQRNLEKIFDKTVRSLESAGKTVSPVPPRLLLPIVEAASVEDHPTLQEMWSGLLASASDKADDMPPSYIETLKTLSPMEARSLKVLYTAQIASNSRSLGYPRDVSRFLSLEVGLTDGESIAPVLVLDTLERLGLIRREYDLQKVQTMGNFYSIPEFFPVSKSSSANNLYASILGIGDYTKTNTERLPEVVYVLAFTSYGFQFMRACEGPKTDVVDEAATYTD